MTDTLGQCVKNVAVQSRPRSIHVVAVGVGVGLHVPATKSTVPNEPLDYALPADLWTQLKTVVSFLYYPK